MAKILRGEKHRITRYYSAKPQITKQTLQPQNTQLNLVTVTFLAN